MSEISTATTHDAQPESQPKVEKSELNSDEKKETAPSIDVEQIPETNTIEETDSSSDDKPLQEVEVVVLDVDASKRRISLGLKQCLPNPWDEFLKNPILKELLYYNIKKLG